MLRPLVLLWLAQVQLGPQHQSAVADWAARRGFRPVPPAQSSALPVAYTPGIAEQIERLLEDARTDDSASASVFEHLDRLLDAHPELPQASWWMAERQALEAQYRLRHGNVDPGRVSELMARAEALEGPRALAYGANPANAPGAAPARTPEALDLVNARPTDQVYLDGVPLLAGGRVAAGRHQVQVQRAGTRVWAAWVDLGSPPRLRIEDPSRACDALDLQGTQPHDPAPQPAAGVLCDAWATARLAPTGDVQVALCRGSHCDPWERVHALAPYVARAADGNALDTLSFEPEAGWPTWATWGLVGTGVALATGLVLWQAGAFDSARPSTEFVFTGPTAAALPF